MIPICGCNRGKRGETIVWRVTYKDGRAPDEFLTELEARAAAQVSGGVYTRAVKNKTA